MATVEELFKQIKEYLGDIDDNQHRDMTIEAIDSLIAAAKEEGVEQESRRWLSEIERAVKEGTLGGFISDALDNVSVLSPAEQDNTMEEEYEDMRRNGGPEAKP
jgi:hypothetical protein